MRPVETIQEMRGGGNKGEYQWWYFVRTSVNTMYPQYNNKK
jgi:hypothetical protein